MTDDVRSAMERWALDSHKRLAHFATHLEDDPTLRDYVLLIHNCVCVLEDLVLQRDPQGPFPDPPTE